MTEEAPPTIIARITATAEMNVIKAENINKTDEGDS